MTTTKNRTTVIDCPAYAWRNVKEQVRNAFYARLDADFVHDHIAALDTAATVLFGPLLATVWAENGYTVSLHGEDGLAHQRRPHGFPWHQVWDTAAARLNPHAVVVEAGLDDELLRYAAAHPRGDELVRQCAGLRPHHQQLRDELHARLDEFAMTAECHLAEQQLDGWRSLVDTATSRAQLEQLATDIPA